MKSTLKNHPDLYCFLVITLGMNTKYIYTKKVMTLYEKKQILTDFISMHYYCCFMNYLHIHI